MSLDVKRLTAGYGAAVVLRDISFTIEPGEILAILGPNGAGKSTLVRCLGGLLPLRSGSIEFEGRSVSSVGSGERVRRGIAQVPEGRHLFPGMTVMENLELGNYTRRGGKDARARVFRLFPALEQFSRTLAGSLSGGQQQMVAVGRALMSDPKLLLMDEPSLGLAPLAVDSILEAAKRLSEDGVAVVLAEQNARKSLRVANRAIFLDGGRIAVEGTPETLQNDRMVLNAYFGEERV